MLIGNNDFINILKNKLVRIKEKCNYFDDKTIKWNKLKYKIKKCTINYRKVKAKEKRVKNYDLEQNIIFFFAKKLIKDNLQGHTD